jgi:hypothetical protein
MPVAKTKVDLQPIVEIRAVNVMGKVKNVSWKWGFIPVYTERRVPVQWFMEYRRSSSKEWNEMALFETGDLEPVENSA